MAKIRVAFLLGTIVLVGLIGLIASYYARGYRFDFKNFRFQPNGIFVIKSEPDGASVYINGELKTATNATISLAPGTYDVEVSKDGFFPWYKRLTITKEIVTQASVSLFRNAPALTPLTFAGADDPIISSDGTKIAFKNKSGLWTLDTYTLPLGFSNEPKKITDADLTNSTYVFSPNGRQIMLTTGTSIFVLDSSTFTSQNEMINVASKKETILKGWNDEKTAKDTSLIKNLPPDVSDILERKTSSFTFSPDSNMILYSASASGTLPDNLISPLPGSSSQKQTRQTEPSQTYVYDIKEDRNFLISSDPTSLRWMPSSRHILEVSEGKVTILDYDGTNRQIVYSGSFVFPFAFPFTNTTKLLVLTNLGGADSLPNLYTLTIK